MSLDSTFFLFIKWTIILKTVAAVVDWVNLGLRPPCLFSFPSKAKAHFPPLIFLNTLIDNVWSFFILYSPDFLSGRSVSHYIRSKASPWLQWVNQFFIPDTIFCLWKIFKRKRWNLVFSNFRSQPQSSASTRNSIVCDNRFSFLTDFFTTGMIKLSPSIP